MHVLSLRPSPRAILLVAAALSPENTVPLEQLKVGDDLVGRVITHHSNERTGRHSCFLEVPVDRAASGGARVAINAQLKLPPDYSCSKFPVGSSLPVRVSQVQLASARLKVRLVPLPPPPGLENLSRRERCASASDPESHPHRLEELGVGEALLPRARVLSTHAFGAIVHAGVSRAGRGGKRSPVEALLPASEYPQGGEPPAPGDELAALRVLRVHPPSGRLVVTCSELGVDELLAAEAERRTARKRRLRRPSNKALATGSTREGRVERIGPYGVVVNVGARRNGLVHISQLARGGLVRDVSDVCDVGDRVEVQVLGGSTGRRLQLRLLRVFPRDDEEEREQRALLRRGQAAAPRFARAEDPAEEGRREAEEAVKEAQLEEEEEEGDEEGEELEEGTLDAMAAWADVLGDAAAPSSPDDEGPEDDEEESGDAFDDFGEDESYFEDKYDVY